VIVIAIPRGEFENSRERSASLQLDRIAALSAVQCRLQVVASADDKNWARGGSVGHRAGYGRDGQLRRTIVSCRGLRE
jgi:hypothetical protein